MYVLCANAIKIIVYYRANLCTEMLFCVCAFVVLWVISERNRAYTYTYRQSYAHDELKLRKLLWIEELYEVRTSDLPVDGFCLQFLWICACNELEIHTHQCDNLETKAKQLTKRKRKLQLISLCAKHEDESTKDNKLSSRRDFAQSFQCKWWTRYDLRTQ